MKTVRLALAFILFVSVSAVIAQQRVEVTNLLNPMPTTGTVNIGTVATVTNPVTAVNATASSFKTEAVGTLSNNAAITTTNLGTIPCLANAAETAYTEGRPVFLSCTLDGALRIQFKDGAGNDRYMYVDASGRGSVSVDAITVAATGTQTAANSDSIVCATDTGCVIKAASGNIASGAYASGALASGSIASGALASGSIASGALASGSFAAGSLSTALPDPCMTTAKTYYVVNLAAAATVEIANAVSSQFFYICSVNLVTAGASAVLIAEDDTDGCGSLSAGLNGGTTAATGWTFAANGGIAVGNGTGTVMKTTTAARYLCIAPSGTSQLSGSISYVSAP